MGVLHQQTSQLQNAHIQNCRPALRLLGFDEESLEEQEILFAADIKNFLDGITIDPFDFRDERSEFSQSRLAIQVKDYMTAASFKALRDICHTSRYGGYKHGRSRRPSQTTEFQEHLLVQELKVVFWKYITTSITSAIPHVRTPSISARTTLRSQPPPMAVMTNSRARSSRNSTTSPSTPQQPLHLERPIKTSCPNSVEKPIPRPLISSNSPVQQTRSSPMLQQTPSSPILPSHTTVPCIIPPSLPPPLLSQSAKTSSTSTSKAPPVYIMVILPTHTTNNCQTPSPKILPYLNPSLWKCSSASLFADLTTTFTSHLVPQELPQPSLSGPDSLLATPGLTTESRQTMINSSPDRITSLQICVRHRNRRKNSPLWLVDVEDEIQWIVARKEILEFMKWDLKAWRARSSADTSSSRAGVTKGSKDPLTRPAGAKEGPYRCWISIEVFVGSAEADQSKFDVYTKGMKGELSEVLQETDMEVIDRTEIEDFDVEHLNCLIWEG